MSSSSAMSLPSFAVFLQEAVQQGRSAALFSFVVLPWALSWEALFFKNMFSQQNYSLEITCITNLDYELN